MKIFTYYERLDNFKIDRAESASNKMLGFLRTAIGKKVTVRYDYHGQKQTSEEYSSAKAKAAVIVLSILLLPLSILAATIGIIVYNFSSTHGKEIQSEKKNEEPETPPPPPSISPKIKDPELPNPPRQSPSLKSPKSETEELPPASPVDDSNTLKIKNPIIQVQLTNEFLKLNPEEFIELIASRGKDVLCLNIENISISVSSLLPQIPNIQVLHFNNCSFVEDDLSGFKNELNSLTKLKIKNCGLTSDHLKTLAGVKFSNLTYLDLSYNWIDDAGIPFLLESITQSKLYFLDLNDNQISTIGTYAIGECDGLRHLEDLSLSNNPIDDEGVLNITSKLPNLQTLTLTSHLVSKKGIRYLEEWAKSAPRRNLANGTVSDFAPSEYE